MAYQTFTHFFGVSDGTARIVALVEGPSKTAGDLSHRETGARILKDWNLAVADPDVDLIDICLTD
ncbi:gfo/Idh/MocA family oxidoreductase, partial [Rhizobium ruizarguesonis]